MSLFGEEGLPDSPDQVSLDMFILAVSYLHQNKNIEYFSAYGQSMGSVFACLVSQYFSGIENLIIVSPTHVPFEGTLKDKITMTGRNVATFQKEDIPFVRADLVLCGIREEDSRPDQIMKFRFTERKGGYRYLELKYR